MSYIKESFTDGKTLYANSLNAFSDSLFDIDRIVNGYSDNSHEDISIGLTNLTLIPDQVALATNGAFSTTKSRTGILIPAYSAKSISLSFKGSCGYNLVYFNTDHLTGTNNIQCFLGSLSTTDYTTTSLLNLPLPSGCKGIYMNVNATINQLSDVFSSIILHNTDLSMNSLVNRVVALEEGNSTNAIGNKLYYAGPPINIIKKEGVHPFYRTLYSTMSGMTSSFQSMIIHGKYVIYFMYNSTNVYAMIYNGDTRESLGTLNLPTGGYKVAHCNVANCGLNYHNGNTELPLIYLSQWDYDGERGMLVYNIDPVNMKAELVQCIRANIDNTIFGAGATDWCLDNDAGHIYALTYYRAGVGSEHPSGAVCRDSKSRVCKFIMPEPTDGENKVVSSDISDVTTPYTIKEKIFTSSDILSYYDIPVTLVSQDKICNNGKMFIGCGAEGYGLDTLCIRVIDLEKEQQVNYIPISDITHGEPEGLDIYDGRLLMGFQGGGEVTGNLWEWHL